LKTVSAANRKRRRNGSGRDRIVVEMQPSLAIVDAMQYGKLPLLCKNLFPGFS